MFAMRLRNEKLLILILLNIVSSQVNTNIEELQKDYEKNEQFYDYNRQAQESSNFRKFMLCTDVIQKLRRIRLMGGPYSYNKSLKQLPEFETIDVTIESSPQPKNVLHCPLSKIKFKKYPKMIIKDFYIISSYKKFCVIKLEPYEESSPTIPVTKIIAEICGVLVDIRYNKEELEEELKQKLERTSRDLNFLQWPELMDMSVEKKMITCFEFYEKNYYYTFHTEDNITIPTFKISNHFRLVYKDGIEWNGHMQTLTCPMDEIDFKTGLSSKMNCKHLAVPFHLARSINPGCVYKVELIETNKKNYINYNFIIINNNSNNTHNHNNQTDEDYRFQVSIQAELCASKLNAIYSENSIPLQFSLPRFDNSFMYSRNSFVSCGKGVLDPPRTNKYQIETEFISAWNTTIQQPDAKLASFELSNLNPASQFRLCQNVYKKIYGKRVMLRHKIHGAKITSSKLGLNNTFLLNVHVLRCPSLPITEPIILLESVNLGCVYSLTERSYHSAILEITAELCDVYPASYLLSFYRQSFKVENYIIDLEQIHNPYEE